MSAHALSLELKVPAPRINDIVRERRAVTPDTALRLARYFSTTPEYWLNLQTAYDLKIAQIKLMASKKCPKVVIASRAKQSRTTQPIDIMRLLRHFIPRNDRLTDFLRDHQS